MISKAKLDYLDWETRNENRWLMVNYQEGTRYYKLRRRYTDEYAKFIYAKFAPTVWLQLKFFVTLTSVNKETIESLENNIYMVRKRWKSARSILSKSGVKKPLYIRAFELGKNNMFHVHIAFFGDILEKEMEDMLLYWSRNVGYIKSYSYNGHHIDKHGHMWAQENETWVNKSKDKITYKARGLKKVGAKAIGYIYKYCVKMPELKQKALMRKYKVRTYSCSYALNKYLKIFKDRFDETFEKEELGEVETVGIHDIETGQYTETYNGKQNIIYKKISDRWLLQRRTYLIDIEFIVNEVNRFHASFAFSGNSLNNIDP